MPKLVVTLPDDRTKTGTLSLVDDEGNNLAGPFNALGMSDPSAAAANGNPNRTSTRYMGDFPNGTYSVAGVERMGRDSDSLHSYGPNQVLELQPTGGDALTARHNGRSGILIHGGDPSATGGLRPTHGCLRLSNDDMASLLKTMHDNHISPAHLTLSASDHKQELSAAAHRETVDKQLGHEFQKHPEFKDIEDTYHNKMAESKEWYDSNLKKGISKAECDRGQATRTDKAQKDALESIAQMRHEDNSISYQDESIRGNFRHNSTLKHIEQDYTEHAAEAKQHEKESVGAGTSATQAHHAFNKEMQGVEDKAVADIKHVHTENNEIETKDRELKHEFKKHGSAYADIAHDYTEQVKEAKQNMVESKGLGIDAATIHEQYNAAMLSAQQTATDAIHSRSATLDSTAKFQSSPAPGHEHDEQHSQSTMPTRG